MASADRKVDPLGYIFYTLESVWLRAGWPEQKDIRTVVEFKNRVSIHTLNFLSSQSAKGHKKQLFGGENNLSGGFFGSSAARQKPVSV